MMDETDKDMDMDIDLDAEFSESDFSENDESTDSDSESEVDEELAEGQNVSRKKRGRPFGSKRRRTESPDDDLLREREPRKKNIIPVEGLMAVMCCAAMCLCGLGLDLMVAHRENYQALSSIERKQWLLDYFWSHSQFDEKSNKWSYLFVIGTVSVCCGAFQKILGIPSSTFYAVRKMFLNKQKVVQNQKQRQKSTKSKSALAWLRNYAANFGEKIPNTCQIHLPPCSTKLHVYETMVTESQMEFEEPISRSHFLRLWREEAQYIAIPRQSRFSKCDTCTLIKTKLGETRDPEQRRVLQEKRDKHLRKQNMERQKYYKHQSKAKSHPEKYLSIIIDGMDQNKTQIPHFVHASKFTSSMWRLRVHLVGVILHGIGVYGF